VESLSLKELKAENADVVEEGKVVEKVINPEVEPTNDEAASEPEAEQAEVVTEPTEEETPEAWMQTEEAENSEDDQKGGFVPNHAVASVRRKLKAKLGVVKDENEALKARIEALEASGNVATPSQVSARPKREDFDFDDEAYDVAVDDWNDKKIDARFATHSQNTQQQDQANKTQSALKLAIDGHYDRANKLVESGKVTEEAYLGADSLVRQTMDTIFPGQGDSVTDSLINTLSQTGEDSDKVMFQLGVNPAKLGRLKALMQSDPSGLSAAAFLGSLQSSITSPNKRKSTTPKPASKADGEGASGGPSGTFHKQYQKAGNDVQARISIKRAAKHKGVDTSQW